MLPSMLKASQQGQSKVQIGDNQNLFDFTYVENIAHAHLLAAQALLATHRIAPTIPLDTERVDGEAFFITNDSPVYFWDFARTVWREGGETQEVSKNWVLSKEFAMAIGMIMEWVYWAMGKGVPNLTRQKARYTCINRYYCIDKAKRRLGYEPVVSLEEGVRRGVKDIMSRQELGDKKAQ